MTYKVLALKYRPQTFKDVIGQTHVTTTLENAILANRVAHAILFTGPRGTGKTTTARILAKAMNCMHRKGSEPCNSCTSCREITRGNCADVFEIDGASNNNVDQVRELRENAAYLPASCRYKIYIIDEVHMLSTAAFNALLKTLEEPPEHILFIFATTEPHKIPATILSRCQRHNLGRIKIDAIAQNIKALCEKEGYSISEKSAYVIAAEADGSIRDSLSLTDRVLSAASGKKIDHDSILENLGLIDMALLFEISLAVIQADGAKLIETIDKVNDLGLDLKKFYSNLIKHFRDLVVVKICGQDTQSIDISDHEKTKIKKMAENSSVSYLTWLLNSLLREETMIKFSSHTKTAVETALLKLLQIREGVDIDSILSKLDLLRDRPLPADEPGPEPDNFPARNPARDTDNSDKTWQGFIKLIETKYPFIAAMFKKGALKEITSEKILVELNSPTPFETDRYEGKKDEINTLCKDHFGPDTQLKIIFNKSIKQENSKEKSFAEKKQEAMTQPHVAETVRMFNGTLIDVKQINQ